MRIIPNMECGVAKMSGVNKYLKELESTRRYQMQFINAAYKRDTVTLELH